MTIRSARATVLALIACLLCAVPEVAPARATSAQQMLAVMDLSKALAIGPAGAPEVIIFTDPDCPYCRALERFWIAREAAGRPVRQLLFFVSRIHPQAAAKAEHILCSPDKEAAFKAIYAGATPTPLRTCAAGAAKVTADAALAERIGIPGTPTIIADGRLILGFEQASLEDFLASHPAVTSR